MKTFTILGCGWLGLELAKSLKNKFNVKVSIRTSEKNKILKDMGFIPYLLNEENINNLDKLLNTNYLFINFPPSKSNNYLLFLEKIFSHKNINNIKKSIFISSSSIYPNEESIFTEDSVITNPFSKIVYEAEEIVKSKTDVILRCTGLFGGDRIAGKYFAGKDLYNSSMKVNYVHRDDVILATKFVIDENLLGVFNLCSSLHPTRKEVYIRNTKKYSFVSPNFLDNKDYKNRIIDGSKIEKKGFRYKYPNPLKYD